MQVEIDEHTQTVSFDHCIIAAGSSVAVFGILRRSAHYPIPAGTLDWKNTQTMLVIGGGIIGLEMANVYSALSSNISIVEFMDKIILAQTGTWWC